MITSKTSWVLFEFLSKHILLLFSQLQKCFRLIVCNKNCFVLCNTFYPALVSCFPRNLLSSNNFSHCFDRRSSKCPTHCGFLYLRGMLVFHFGNFIRLFKNARVNVLNTSNLFCCIRYVARRAPFWHSHTLRLEHSKNIFCFLPEFVNVTLWVRQFLLCLSEVSLLYKLFAEEADIHCKNFSYWNLLEKTQQTSKTSPKEIDTR